MGIIACGQNEIMPDICPGCGGWIHADLDDGTPSPGFPGPHGWLFCSEDCAEGCQRAEEENARRTHLNQRDLMCTCEVCTAAGHPTPAELAEYRAYCDAQAGGE